MSVLAIALDGENLIPPDWFLFRWCVYLPLSIVALSWVLIRWRRAFVGLAVAMAVGGAAVLLVHLFRDLRFREEHKEALEQQLHNYEQMLGTVEPEHKAVLERSIWDMQNSLARFDWYPIYWVPPYDNRMIATVWFAAGFPFILVAAFYYSERSKHEVRNSPPKSSQEKRES
ncbi:MAG TPA: hypothetical protein VHD32_13105 [Candidatus Didemnitutus sp.]|nr:hypothetical protein [Candidatus Didemnitutus sp.]